MQVASADLIRCCGKAIVTCVSLAPLTALTQLRVALIEDEVDLDDGYDGDTWLFVWMELRTMEERIPAEQLSRLLCGTTSLQCACSWAGWQAVHQHHPLRPCGSRGAGCAGRCSKDDAALLHS